MQDSTVGRRKRMMHRAGLHCREEKENDDESSLESCRKECSLEFRVQSSGFRV